MDLCFPYLAKEVVESHPEGRVRSLAQTTRRNGERGDVDQALVDSPTSAERADVGHQLTYPRRPGRS